MYLSTLITILLIGANYGHYIHKDDVKAAMDTILYQNEGVPDLEYGDVKRLDGAPEGSQGALIKRTRGTLWPGKLVYYSFTNQFNADHRRTVRSALNTIEQTTCIRFQEFPKGQAPGHYILIKSEGGCWSYIGKTDFKRTGYQDMSLAIPGCVHASVVMHEFIHALGAYHEQSRPDRDQYIEVREENMQDGGSSQFKKQSYNNVDSLGVAYDGESIMHYSGYAFSKNRKPTMVWRADHNKKLGGGKLTPSDILQLNRLYQCDGNPPPPTTTTTTTMKPTTMTTTTTTMTTKMTTEGPKGCKQHPICVHFPKEVCEFSYVQKDCPLLCGKCEVKTTTTTTTMKPTTMSTTTMAPTTMTTEPMTTEGDICGDVSSHCKSKYINCNRSIYQTRCRKSCNLCNSPLPRQCQGLKDDMADCPMKAANSQCRSSPHVRKQCAVSCCLRGERY